MIMSTQDDVRTSNLKYIVYKNYDCKLDRDSDLAKIILIHCTVNSPRINNVSTSETCFVCTWCCSAPILFPTWLSYGNTRTIITKSIK